MSEKDECKQAEPRQHDPNAEDAELLRSGCIIEIAVRNPNVSSYMNHWEGRALKAEAELERVHGGTAPVSAADIEALAAYAHEAWSGWMRHLFSKGHSRPTPNGMAVTLPGEWAERWMRQTNTPYADLREDEKESDRKEARRMLAIISTPPSTESPSLPVGEVFMSGCTDQDFHEWWDKFGSTLSFDERINDEALALAAFCAGRAAGKGAPTHSSDLEPTHELALRVVREGLKFSRSGYLNATAYDALVSRVHVLISDLRSLPGVVAPPSQKEHEEKDKDDLSRVDCQ